MTKNTRELLFVAVVLALALIGLYIKSERTEKDLATCESSLKTAGDSLKAQAIVCDKILTQARECTNILQKLADQETNTTQTNETQPTREPEKKIEYLYHTLPEEYLKNPETRKFLCWANKTTCIKGQCITQQTLDYCENQTNAT